MPDDLDPAAFCLWTIPDELTGKRRRTSYRLQPADALECFPDAVPDLASQEVRWHIGGAGGISCGGTG